MNKTYCVDCQKEIEYKGFCCPIRCYECEKKQIENSKPIYTLTDKRYVARQMGRDKTNCLICDEEIRLTEDEFSVILSGGNIVKVCDKCKQVIMKMRETIEHEGKGE